jgi:hypothetical protein
LTSSGQLKLMQRTNGRQFSKAGAAFKFGPAEGSGVFLRFGWKAARAEVLKTAERLNRAPAELLTSLPIPRGLAGVTYGLVCLPGQLAVMPQLTVVKVEKFFSQPKFDRWPQTRSQIKMFILIDLGKPCIGMWFAHIPIVTICAAFRRPEFLSPAHARQTWDGVLMILLVSLRSTKPEQRGHR